MIFNLKVSNMDLKQHKFVVRTEGDIHRVRARGKAIRDAMDFQSEELAAMNANLFKPKKKKGKKMAKKNKNKVVAQPCTYASKDEGTNFWANAGILAAGVALGVGAVWGYNELKDALSNSDITIIDGDGSVYNETARSFA